MQRLPPTAPTIDMSADQTSSYFKHPKESRVQALPRKSTDPPMSNFRSKQLHNNISALVSLSTTNSEFHLSASDAIASNLEFHLSASDVVAQLLDRACEPTPFADGTYLQPLTEDSKTLFVPTQEFTNDTTPRTFIHCNHQSINSQLLRDERLSDSMEDSDENEEDDLSRTSSNAAKKKNTSKYFQHQEDRWMEHFQSLLRYKEMHGNCHVPQNYPQDPALARWARRQRHQFKQNRQMHVKNPMSKERQLMLEQAGFVWDPQMDNWEIRRQELEAYKEKYGHCNVPSRYAENPGLATWVKRQRTAHRQFQSGETVSRVRKQRFEILNKMEFVWKRSNK